jgi:hypothetical protein
VIDLIDESTTVTRREEVDLLIRRKLEEVTRDVEAGVVVRQPARTTARSSST